MFCGMFVDITGVPIERTPSEHPYSYDPFCIYRSEKYNKMDGCDYSDRLYQWDSKKFDDCYSSVWKTRGQAFNGKNPEDVEKFLSLYFNKKIVLTAIMQCCNFADGNPYWLFYYREEVDKTK